MFVIPRFDIPGVVLSSQMSMETYSTSWNGGCKVQLWCCAWLCVTLGPSQLGVEANKRDGQDWVTQKVKQP